VKSGDMIRGIREIAFAARLNRMTSPLTFIRMQTTERAMRKFFVILAACAACATSGAALAQTATQPMGASPRVERAIGQLQTRFSSANTTHDGKLTRAQASAGMPMVAKHFDQIDTQKNGYVTLPQIEAFMREHAAQR
jgi:hypothetical protein